MIKLLWPLLVVNLGSPGWFDEEQHILFKITQLLFYLATLDELRAERKQTIFDTELEAWRHKMFHIFHFLQYVMVSETETPFSCIFNAISREKSCLISMPFLTWLDLTCPDVRTVKFFPPAESWLVNSNFPRASRMQKNYKVLYISSILAGGHTGVVTFLV